MKWSTDFHVRIPVRLAGMVLLLVLISGFQVSAFAEMDFEIRGYAIENNQLVPDGDIQELLWPYIGYAKTTDDVEKARVEVEKFLQKQGFIRVMVNIPEQSIEDGIVRLEVLDAKIARVKVTGNRYYTKDMLLRELPSIAPGQVLHVPAVNEDFGRLARNPNLKVKLGLVPGRKSGEDTIELQIEDQLPLHGEVGLNNYASHNTSDLRVNAMLRYDNLWQKNHSLSVQAQTSPEKTEEVLVFSGSYTMPTDWNPSDLLVFYAVWSDSQSATGGDINVIGKGNIIGARYIKPLPDYKSYSHNLTFGVDYKNFDETVNFGSGSETPIVTPVTYLPVSVNYGASLPDVSGTTLWSAGVSGTIRGLSSEQEEFAEKNYRSRGNYLVLSSTLERRQKLPGAFQINTRIKGQLASEPLISNEQFTAGGVESVHGYKESEAAGDNAVYTSFELLGPELMNVLGKTTAIQATPGFSYEHASLFLREPLEGQQKNVSLNGLGITLRGQLHENLKYRFDWGYALSDTAKTDSGTQRGYFSLSYQF